MSYLNSYHLSDGRAEVRDTEPPAKGLALSGVDGTNPLAQVAFCPVPGPQEGRVWEENIKPHYLGSTS